MTSRIMTLSTVTSSEPTFSSLASRGTNSGNIHTLQDFRRSTLTEDRELADLLNRARSTFDQTRKLAERNRSAIDTLGSSLAHSYIVLKRAEDGQKNLHEKVSSTNKKLAEAR